MVCNGFWKNELKYNQLKLKLWLSLYGVFGEYADHQVSKIILYSVVIIRKMFEDEKGKESFIENKAIAERSLKLIKHKTRVVVYPFSGDKDFIVERVIPDNYDFKNLSIEELELNKLCNQIIHSYVWSVVHKPYSNEIYGVAFSSDKSKTEVLYLLEPKEFIKTIRFCIENGKL